MFQKQLELFTKNEICLIHAFCPSKNYKLFSLTEKVDLYIVIHFSRHTLHSHIHSCTVCAKDSGTYNCACQNWCACLPMGTGTCAQSSLVCALFFFYFYGKRIKSTN